jgi:hypothetical protein
MSVCFEESHGLELRCGLANFEPSGTEAAQPKYWEARRRIAWPSLTISEFRLWRTGSSSDGQYFRAVSEAGLSYHS